MNAFFELLLSPVGPPLLLLAGGFVLLTIGRWVRQPGWLTGLALFFAAGATLLWGNLRVQSIVPTFSVPWQPLLQGATNLVWVGDGWNWYISGLILLLGSLGLLLDRTRQSGPSPAPRQLYVTLGMDLAVLACALLFVGSANVLTTLFTWVLLDLAILLRGAVMPFAAVGATRPTMGDQSRVLSLLGAFLLLLGLLPAGVSGPAQPLLGGTLPAETVTLMMVAGAIRAGVYPFHLWLLPQDKRSINLSERLLDHMPPVLCGLWLMAWAADLGGLRFLAAPEVLAVQVVMVLAAALAAFTAEDQPSFTAFVLIAAAGMAVLAGALSSLPGPRGFIWAVTVFALGGALWLIGDQVWRAWGWQIPVSVGALALAGVPFTPGFISQASYAELMTSGWLFVPLYIIYLLAQSLLVAAVLRSWNFPTPHVEERDPKYFMRLLIACLALGLPLAVSGFLPSLTMAISGVYDAIPPGLGNPPTVVAGWQVWLTLAIPLAVGYGLVQLQPRWRAGMGDWPARVSNVSQLNWLYQVVMWGVDQTAQTMGNGLRVLEGSGYLGWFLVFLLAILLMLR